MICASRTEVWKVDPSDGSLYVVTKRLRDSMDSLRLAELGAERSSPRQLKVEVTAAELLPAITGTQITSAELRLSTCVHSSSILLALS